MEAEEVDQHLEANAEALTLEAKLPNLCAIYHAVKPILKFARALLFWKPKWRDALDKLMASLDDACPLPETPVTP